MTYQVLNDALFYLDLGWSVIPVKPGGKQPLIPWRFFESHHARRNEVRDWFTTRPDANIGVVTGKISGLVVLDIDSDHGGISSLRELERSHGTLPATVEAITGGGGLHLYFTHPGGTIRNTVGMAPGVDLRGDGGFVVAPPSMHASGRHYVWRPGHAPRETLPAALPIWLSGGNENSIKRGHSIEHWRSLVRDGVAEGERNNTVASLAGRLLWHGVDPSMLLELLLCWNRVRCRPPLPDEEVARTVESIVRTHTENR